LLSQSKKKGDTKKSEIASLECLHLRFFTELEAQLTEQLNVWEDECGAVESRQEAAFQ
jgi:hypothetical protein